MAPVSKSNTTAKRDKRLDNILAFAQEVLGKLPDLVVDNDNQSLIDELETQIRAIKSSTPKTTRKNHELDALGTELWNAGVRLSYDNKVQTEPVRKVVLLTRLFAFQMLAIAQGTDTTQIVDLIRLTKLAIKVGRLCLDGGLESFSHLALQKAADYTGLLQGMKDTLPEEEKSTCTRLVLDYFILRIVASWKEDRLDVAEFIYTKSEWPRQELEPTAAEDLADALFEVGHDQLRKKDFPMAVKWLERAHNFVNIQQLDQLSREALELRLSILQAFVRALLGTNTADGLQAAEYHVDRLESELGDKLVVLLLRLEVLQKAPGEVFDDDAYGNVLRRMMRTVTLSESTFKLIISHIRRLHDKSPTRAINLLDHFLVKQVSLLENTDWTDRAFLLRVVLSTSGRDTMETVGNLRSILDHVLESTGKPLPADPALAILTLIWKKVEANSAQGQLDLCEAWCKLASHTLLEQYGPINAGKIARKSLLCALDRNDLDSAKEIFVSLNASAKAQPMTMYLVYKLALRSGDVELASDCIQAISRSAPKDHRFLYACCLAAQRSGDKLCSLQALQLVADRHASDHGCEVHLPALFRSIVRIHTSLLEDKTQSDANQVLIVDGLCKTFEAVVAELKSAQSEAGPLKTFAVAELSWFVKNAYNLGIKHASDWSLESIIRMCKACVSIMQHFPQDIPEYESGDISLREAFCHFMITTAYIAIARAEDNVERQLQNYLNSRKHTAAFETRIETMNQSDKDCIHDLQTKLTTLLVFDFEAAVSLKAWDELGIIVRKAATHKNLQALQATADFALRVQPPAHVISPTLRIIINEIFKLEEFDSMKLAKYLRCLLKIVLADVNLSLTQIDQICHMVKDASKTPKPFPSEEIQWFAVTAYNQSVDYNLSQEDELSRKWIEHAFSLAHYYRDGGILEKTMHEHYTKLSWDRE